MNRLLLTILTVLSLTSNILGQVPNDLKKVLASKDFVAFKKYTDNLTNRKNGINSHWECLRDLTPDFQEGVFIIEKLVPEKDNPSISSVYTYKVSIISTKTTIIYYELSEKKNKKIGTHWEPYYERNDQFRDEKAFDSLKVSFKKIFQSDLSENELFMTDFVYGEHCGIVGENPKGRQQIDEWVADKNKTDLLKWLKSTNTEKQIYAVDGLLQLKKKGTTFSKDEVKIIQFVISKRGTMYVCSGCIHSIDDINSVTKNFKL